MEAYISNVENIKFFIELQLEEQIGALALPYSGMDKTGSGACIYFLEGSCHMRDKCPFRHVRGDQTIVCKHWLRGLCKKGDNCEFLHEYDMTKMPECWFFTKHGECNNKECPFLHNNLINRDCAWYDRGFCRNGPNCKKRHTRRVACSNYINGFCPSGKDCKFVHPRWALPGYETNPIGESKQKEWVCHHCGQKGHKIQFCFKLPLEERERIIAELQERRCKQRQPMDLQGWDIRTIRTGPGIPGVPHMINRFGAKGSPKYLPHQPRVNYVQRPIKEVTCFKCGDQGHYANKCSEGHLAFLSKTDQED